ncbi:MAG TPA: hypothetical protein VFR02_02330, partial [bacterium]|nr:hypothetical protein [bacterium]
IPLAAPSGGRLDLALRLPLSPDPWFPALGNALVVLVLTLLLLRTAPASGSARVPAADPPAASPVPLPPGPADPDSQAVLDVDEGYRLGSVSPRAALLLRQDREALLGRHLLDLAPHPALLEIMRSGLEGSVPDPFPPLPLAARVLPETNRWKIRLEPTQNGQKR